MAVVTEHVVYVVDDDQGMLDSTVWLLESVGLKAMPFISGVEFLEACHAKLNACVLLDVRMPGMGGLEHAGSHTRAQTETANHLRQRSRRCAPRGLCLQGRRP